MNRKAFLKLSTSIIGGLSIPGVFEGTTYAAETKPGTGVPLDESYLVKGLTGRVRAEGWFNAHWGAGVLAGYYLCRENQLGEQTTSGIKEQSDAVIRLRGAQFAPLPQEPADEALIEDVPAALPPGICSRCYTVTSA